MSSETETAAITELQQELNKVVGKRSSAGRSDFNDEMFLAGETLLQMDPNIGLQIDAHGLTKPIFRKADGSGELDSYQIRQLVNLLTNGIDRSRPFSTAPLAVPGDMKRLMGPAMGTSGGTAYTQGAFIIISDFKKSLTGKNNGDGIKAVLVNPMLRSLVPILKKHFHNVNFFTYDKINDYLCGLGVIDTNTRDQYNLKIQSTLTDLHKNNLLSSIPVDNKIIAKGSGDITAHPWKIGTYDAGPKGRKLFMWLDAGKIASAINQLREAGFTEQDFTSRDGTRVVLQGSDEKIQGFIKKMARVKNIDLQNLH